MPLTLMILLIFLRRRAMMPLMLIMLPRLFRYAASHIDDFSLRY